MKTTRSFLLAASVSLALALTFTACGSDDGDDDKGNGNGNGNSSVLGFCKKKEPPIMGVTPEYCDSKHLDESTCLIMGTVKSGDCRTPEEKCADPDRTGRTTSELVASCPADWIKCTINNTVYYEPTYAASINLNLSNCEENQ
jgi:hypothetical protein